MSDTQDADKPKVTRTSNKEILAAQQETNALLKDLVGALTAQHSTPAAVVDAVAPSAPAVPVQEKPKTVWDRQREFVESKGYALANGGTVVGNVEVALAIARVLKTGTPEIVSLAGVESDINYEKRNISGVSIVPGDKPQTFVTSYVFRPQG